jgi:hypothetical protein
MTCNDTYSVILRVVTTQYVSLVAQVVHPWFTSDQTLLIRECHTVRERLSFDVFGVCGCMYCRLC